MQDTKVKFISLDDDGTVEMRIKLDLFDEPFVSEQLNVSEVLYENRRKLKEANGTIRLLDEKVAELESQCGQLSERNQELERIVNQQRDSLSEQTAIQGPPPQAPRQDRPAPAEESVTLRVPRQQPAPAEEPATQPDLPEPTIQDIVAQPAMRGSAPVAVMARNFTDSLLEIDMSFGLGHKIGSAFRRLFGRGKVSDWDDLDDDVVTFKAPWYKRPAVLGVLVVATVVVFLCLGGTQWIASKLHAIAPAEASETTVEAPSPLETTPDTEVNVVAGSPLEDKPAVKKPRRRHRRRR
ncbi:hypothetical protein ACFL6C_08800 [Myxococcota bacterium]